VSGALTPVPGSPFAAGTFPISVAIDPTGTYVYVANLISNNIYAYSINPATVALLLAVAW
jgi:DNA-binding beta-propeller fold protein YncE